MKEIPLNHGKVAIVDDDDYDRLMQHRWHLSPRVGRYLYACANGRVVNKIKGHRLVMHRIIVGLDPSDPRVVDHKNHNTLDNRKENLRICTRSQNRMNSRRFKENKGTGIRGVMFDKRRGTYFAQTHIGSKNKWLGSFATAAEASKRYNEVVREVFGEFYLEEEK